MTRAQDEGCARVSELACWYDNEEGDFRRSMHRGERPEGRKTSALGRAHRIIRTERSRGPERDRGGEVDEEEERR